MKKGRLKVTKSKPVLLPVLALISSQELQMSRERYKIDLSKFMERMWKHSCATGGGMK